MTDECAVAWTIVVLLISGVVGVLANVAVVWLIVFRWAEPGTRAKLYGVEFTVPHQDDGD